MAQCLCDKCGKMMEDTNFYTYKDGTKTEMCKKCLTMHIDNFDPKTFTWLLEKMDVPYVEEEWNVLRDRAFAKDPYKMNGSSVFGKYLSKMKLRQWKDYGWDDNDRIRAELDQKILDAQLAREEMSVNSEALKAQYEEGLISEAEYKTLADPLFQNQNLLMQMPADVAGANNPYREENFMSEEELYKIDGELTEDDKIYLAMKWGRLYKPSEWIMLEKNYKEYESSFDLHNADLQRGTLQLCKLDLKCNQALDCGDVDGYSKLARASDTLRKSLKFTEAQRKEDKGSQLSCYGQIVAFCELNNYDDYIPMLDLSIDRDMVDRDIRDIKQWTQTLVEDDPTIYKMIEQYIKKREIAKQMEEDQQNADDGVYSLTDQDLKDYRDQEEEERELDDLSIEEE